MGPVDMRFLRATTALRALLKELSTSPKEDPGAGPRGLDSPPVVILGVSGGADSLALAVCAAQWKRMNLVHPIVVVVDHGLQEGSPQAAEEASRQCSSLGLEARIDTANPDSIFRSREGLEAAARKERYAALVRHAWGEEARAILTAHTLNDQAEQVLLGLGRGSGTRSLAGIPLRSELPVEDSAQERAFIPVLRPFLDPEHGLWRQDTLTLCQQSALVPWEDPSNRRTDRPRTALRHEALPALEKIFPGVRKNLVRTASISVQDADYLEEQTKHAYENTRRSQHGCEEVPGISWPALSVRELRLLHPALRTRVLSMAIAEARKIQEEHSRTERPPGEFPEDCGRGFSQGPTSAERLRAVLSLVLPREEGGSDSPGPIELPGGLSVRRGEMLTGRVMLEQVIFVSAKME